MAEPGFEAGSLAPDPVLTALDLHCPVDPEGSMVQTCTVASLAFLPMPLRGDFAASPLLSGKNGPEPSLLELPGETLPAS